MKTKHCKCCKEEFVPNKKYLCQKFCSQKCYHKFSQGRNASNFKGGLIKIKCDFCNKEICKKPCLLKTHKYLFCSRKCYYNFMQELFRDPRSNPNYKNGKTFKTYICIKCRRRICYNTYFSGSKLCRSCASRENLKDITKNPWYVDGNGRSPYPLEFNDTLREQIRKRDNYECQNCSMTEEEHLIVHGRTLDVHHIDYNKQNCNEDNLIALCQQCNLRANSNRDYWQNFYNNKINRLIKKGDKNE